MGVGVNERLSASQAQTGNFGVGILDVPGQTVEAGLKLTGKASFGLKTRQKAVSQAERLHPHRRTDTGVQAGWWQLGGQAAA